jgi:hypothetical protein
MATRAPVREWVGEAGDCPRCGTTYSAGQEYCLECGVRLPEEDGDGRAAGTFAAGTGWAWPVLVALVVASLAVAGVLAARLTNRSSEEAVVATAGPPPLVPQAQPRPVSPEPVPTLPTPRVTRPQPTKPRAAPRGGLVEWPAGRNGWTLVLASYPTAAGRAAALDRATAASKAGLARVGVLDSSDYSSLHPGYFVVFSGVFGSLADAQGALDDAHSKGYSTAYVKQITPAR